VKVTVQKFLLCQRGATFGADRGQTARRITQDIREELEIRRTKLTIEEVR
jgi:hypothetical protein